MYLTRFNLTDLTATYLGGAGDELLDRRRIDSYKGMVRFLNGMPIFNFFERGVGYLSVGNAEISGFEDLKKEELTDYEL